MNTSIIHKSGALLLEPLDHMVIEVSLSGGRAFAINRDTPREKLKGMTVCLGIVQTQSHECIHIHTYTYNHTYTPNHPHTHVHTAFLTPGLSGSPHLSNTLPLNNEPQDDVVGMDDSLDNMGGDFNDHLSPPQIVPELRPRGYVKIREEPKVSDPWTLLDPHDPGNKAQNKPFRKGKCLVFPSN